MISGFVELFFPRTCIICSEHLIEQEEFICLDCLFHLPQTHYHTIKDNPLEKIFWGRVRIERAFSLLHFKKEGAVQKILHQLKYHGNKELAEYMGQYYGGRLKRAGIMADCVMAVPLHPSKLLKRGYNQSAWFAKGLCQSMGIEDVSHLISRTTATETQTKKSRFERYTNVKDVFLLNKQADIQNKSLIIVDDVITTGATIEAMINALSTENQVNIMVTSIAVAG